MRKMEAVVGIAAVVLLLAGAYFIFFNSGEEAWFEGEVERLTLGAETSLLTAAVWIAEDKGFFKEQNLEILIEEFESGKASFNDMLDGGVDISTVAPTPIMFNSFKRADFFIFATFVSSVEDVKVIARKDSGINSAQDLKGKRVGTPVGTTGQFFLAAFLTFRNMEESDVEVVDISPSNLPEALNNKEVDAIVIWEPHANNAKKLLGDNAAHLQSSDVYDETFNFMVMKDFAEQNPEAIKRFLKAIDKATEFIKENKEESQEIVAERLGLNKEEMAVLWDDFSFDISLKQSLLLTLEDEARWAISSKLTTTRPIGIKSKLF
ncbi:MAG: NrtA/SsuA/CpmA family ABC transporter substrate-binding protein [archaeon]|jgi:NitT/TauT family transport system substrate-binding protein|nr:NrtA/SsuA/CpmA family ABC transporter substrate-binding protein [archaeon]